MRRALLALAVAALAAAAVPSGFATARGGQPPVRFTTFDASLNRTAAGELRAELEDALADSTADAQLAAVRRIIEINNPHVLLINELDDQPGNPALFAALAGQPCWFEAAPLHHLSDPRFDTADFADTPGQAGNLRADGVLPSNDLRIDGAAGLWPVQDDPKSALRGVFAFPSSDHRLVVVDVRVPGR